MFINTLENYGDKLLNEKRIVFYALIVVYCRAGDTVENVEIVFMMFAVKST